MIDFQCPYCGGSLRMSDSFAGRDGWCRLCKRMVIVPEGLRNLTVEDLPPGDAIRRLQKLLQYAARKADEHKACAERRSSEKERRAGLERALAASNRALAESNNRFSALEVECSALKKAAEQQEREWLDGAAATEAALNAKVSELAARLGDSQSALEAERENRCTAEELVGQLRDTIAQLEQSLSEQTTRYEVSLAKSSSFEMALGQAQQSLKECEASLTQVTMARDELAHRHPPSACPAPNPGQSEGGDLAKSGAKIDMEVAPDACVGLDAGNPVAGDRVEMESLGDGAVDDLEAAGLTSADAASSNCATKRPWAILPAKSAAPGEKQRLILKNAVLGKAIQHMGKEAFVERWHREAEVQGATQAQFRLGVRYEKGLGVGQDTAEALRWFLRAADQGHKGAQHHLGRLYAEGRGVVKNPTMALDWFRKAAEQGDAASQCELGVLCLTGTGVSRDLEAAVSWFRKSAEQGNPAALFHLGTLHVDGVSVPSNPALAFEYFQRAAEKGHADAQHRVGQILSEGGVVTRDECRALDWFSKAAEQGHPQAQYALGMCLERGRGAVQNYIRAYAWYNLAAVRLDQARAARDRLATLMSAEQILQGQQLAEDMHIKRQADESAL